MLWKTEKKIISFLADLLGVFHRMKKKPYTPDYEIKWQ